MGTKDKSRVKRYAKHSYTLCVICTAKIQSGQLHLEYWPGQRTSACVCLRCALTLPEYGPIYDVRQIKETLRTPTGPHTELSYAQLLEQNVELEQENARLRGELADAHQIIDGIQDELDGLMSDARERAEATDRATE